MGGVSFRGERDGDCGLRNWQVHCFHTYTQGATFRFVELQDRFSWPMFLMPGVGSFEETKEDKVIRRITLFSVIVGVCITLAYSAGEASQEAEMEAVKAAEAWLALVDGGKYAESWDDAAELFRNAVDREQWNQTMTGFREPLGRVIVRSLKSKHYTTSLPGAPDGEYVVIQYETSFENKRSAVETITPMLDRGGSWRVSGYYIK